MRKINDIKIAEYFSLYEFECPCCRRVMLFPALLARLDHLRGVINRPIYINSGYRCPEENRRVGGAPSSYHLVGMAADIYVQDFSLSDLLLYAKELDFRGIGLYEKENFLHVDIRPGERRIWKGKELIGY